MSPPGIPEDVLQFIAERIDTVPQFEALLLLWENRPREWTDAELAARIYVERSSAASILEALQRRHLLASEGTPPRYRYHDASDPGGTRMQAVAAAYRQYLIPITMFIHSRASSPVREFARAFDLKKDH